MNYTKNTRTLVVVKIVKLVVNAIAVLQWEFETSGILVLAFPIAYGNL